MIDMCKHTNVKDHKFEEEFNYDYDLYDTDTTYKHFIQVCKDCSCWRFKTKISDYSESDSGHHYTKFGVWSETNNPLNDEFMGYF